MAERIKGVDISAWQEGIPFDEIKKAGVWFAVIRAGCGKNKDSQLDKFVADRAKEEADACISVIKQYNPDYPVYYDIEDKNQIGQLTTRICTDMCHINPSNPLRRALV